MPDDVLVILKIVLSVLFAPVEAVCEHLLRLLLEFVQPRQPLEVLCVFAGSLDEPEGISPVRLQDL